MWFKRRRRRSLPRAGHRQQHSRHLCDCKSGSAVENVTLSGKTILVPGRLPADVIYRKPKQTAFPCRPLGGENFRRRYGCPGAERPLPDVQRRVSVRAVGMTARDTFEGGLVGTVSFVDTPARHALTRGVPRIDKTDGHASTLRLVDDEAAELGECPIYSSLARRSPPLAVTRARMPFRFSRASPRSVRLASATSAFDITWLVCCWNLLCLPESLVQSALCGLGAAFLQSPPPLLGVAALSVRYRLQSASRRRCPPRERRYQDQRQANPRL